MRLFFMILGGAFLALAVFDMATAGVGAFVDDNYEHRTVAESWGRLFPDPNDFESSPQPLLDLYDFVQSQISYQFFGILGLLFFMLAPILFPKKLY